MVIHPYDYLALDPSCVKVTRYIDNILPTEILIGPSLRVEGNAQPL